MPSTVTASRSSDVSTGVAAVAGPVLRKDDYGAFRALEPGTFNVVLARPEAIGLTLERAEGTETVPWAHVDLVELSRTPAGVMVNLSGADAFDVEYSPSLKADSWNVIASDVTTFEDTNAARVGTGVGFYRGVAR